MINEEITTKIEEQIFLAKHYKDDITLYQLDTIIADILNVTSVFKSNDNELIALKNFQRLVYRIDSFEKDNIVSNNVILFVTVGFNIDGTKNLKDDFSNILLYNISAPNIYDLDDTEKKEEFNSWISWATVIDKSIRKEIDEHRDDYTNEELKELLKNYVVNGIDNPMKNDE